MHIELLENRIAPAGIVKISVTAADIKITGDDAANLITEVKLTDLDAVRITAAAGTQLEFNGSVGATFDIPLGARKNLVVELGAGDDELSMADFEPWVGAIAVNGGAGANLVRLAGAFDLGGSFSYTGGADADELLAMCTQFRASSVLLDMKDGTNSCKWEFSEFDASSVKLRGGNGNDTVELGGSGARLGGLDVNLGDGANTMTVGVERIRLGGLAKITGGAGPDIVKFNPNELGGNSSGGSAAYFRKGIAADLGGGGNTFTITGSDSLTVRGALALKFGDPDAAMRETQNVLLGGKSEVSIETLEVLPEKEDEVLIALGTTDPGEETRSMHFGDIILKGARTVAMTATSAVAIHGELDVQAGNFPEGMSLMIASPFLHVGKDLRYATDAGAGGSRIWLDVDVVDIGGAVAVGYNLGDTGTHEVGHLTEGGSFSAKSVKISDPCVSPGAGALTVNFQSSIEVGTFSLNDVAGDASATFRGSNVDVEGFFKIDWGYGAAALDMEGASFSAGGVKLRSAAAIGGTEMVSMDYEEIAWVLLDAQFGDAASAFSIEADRGRISAASITLGGGANLATLIGNGVPNGEYFRVDKLRVLSATGPSSSLERLVIGGIQSTKEVLIGMGAADSAVKIFNSRISRIATLLGAGADTLEVDDTRFAGAATFKGGIGADNFAIEIGGAFAGFTSFRGPVKIDLGAGDDVLAVASAIAASNARFAAAVTVDGGEGTDTYTAHPTNATFGIIAVLIGI